MSQLYRPFINIQPKAIFIRSIVSKTQYEVVSPLNKFNLHRLYSTSSSSSSDTPNSTQPKNLGFLKAIQTEDSILTADRNPVLNFEAIEEFNNYETSYDKSKEQYQFDSQEQIKIETPRIEVNDQQAPYYHASKQAEKSLRSHLSRFFIKVHPDIFHSDESSRSINQNSLTKLNNLLRTLEEYIEVSENDNSEISKLDKIQNSITLNFIVEFEEDGGIGQIVQEFTFTDPPESILTSKSSLLQYVTELRFSVYRQIYSLLEKAGVSVPKSDKELLKNPEPVAKEIYDDPWEEFYSESTKNLSLTTQLEEFLKEFPVTEDRLTANHSHIHQRLLDQFQENRVFFYFGENAKGDIDIMRHLNLREEAEYQIIHLKENLLSLEFQEWNTLPIAIVDPQYYNIMEPTLTAKGFVVFEKDFDPFQALSYIKEVVIPKTTKNFKHIFSIVNNNREALEEKTIRLENLLSSSSVIVENLFSINQKTLEKVRESFNQSLTIIGELKIPAIQLLDAVKAETWRQLPLTNFNDSEFQRWKINNVITNSQEKLEYIAAREEAFVERGRVPQPESRSSQWERMNKTLEKITNPESQPKQSDIRERPLTLVDKNQFDSVQSTPFITSSLNTIDRLTKLFETKTPVPFLLSEKPISHPLLPLKEKSVDINERYDFNPQGIYIEPTIEDSKKTLADELGIGNMVDSGEVINELDEIGEENFDDVFDDDYDEMSAYKEDKEQTIAPLTNEEYKKVTQIFGHNNVIPIENAEKIVPTYVAKINFMTTGNNFENTTPIPINGPIIASGEVNSATKDPLDIESILNDAKDTPAGISSDLDDFFSKLSNLDETQTAPPKNETIFEKLQNQYANPIDVVTTTNVEWTESIQMINQSLSDFKWENINLIISDHYQFIITHDNKIGFCFIPSNFDEKELFIFLNSVQDSFDLINGGSNKAKEEYALKSLLAVENAVNQLQHLYKFKSILVNNRAIPSKLQQFSIVNSIANTLQSKTISPVENITLKNICPHSTLVLSDSYAIQFLNEKGKPIDENDVNQIQKSKHVKIYANVDQLDLNIFLKYVFVTLSENSQFFKDIITRTYQLPTPPTTPSIEEVTKTINELYGFDRITPANQPYEVDLEGILATEFEEEEDIPNSTEEVGLDFFDDAFSSNEHDTLPDHKISTTTSPVLPTEAPNVFSASSFLEEIQRVSQEAEKDEKDEKN
ncbi:hypothetical protein RB653_003035 [Dictyostelium firmibasis]|uniref:DUF4460 domain-containing protein n=1 Tax=Dictyostelium firmibasis TaxID=79012 RepID=A0AAN7TXL2_9MYCE